VGAGEGRRVSPEVDLLVAGSYCHDTLRRPGGDVHTLGGSAAYVGAVLEQVGADFRVASVVGEDFRYTGEVPQAPRVRGPHTTAFTSEVHGAQRTLWLTARAPPLRPDDLEVDARVGLACAVAGEVPPDTLLRLTERCARVLVDAQGLLRVRGADGRVGLVALARTAYAPLLSRVHVLKASEEEASFLDLGALRRHSCVVITRGARGCTLLQGEGEREVPALPVHEVDPTGAGDCFLAGFALGLLRGLPLEGCAELARWFGAQAVTQVGVPRLPPSELSALLRSHP
jgi:1D-myo-inositol 3-kinase